VEIPLKKVCPRCLGFGWGCSYCQGRGMLESFLSISLPIPRRNEKQHEAFLDLRPFGAEEQLKIIFRVN
jgi:hypothetical protein